MTSDRSIFVTFKGRGPRVVGYPYLWVKNVVGFDARFHCAKCLRGQFLKQSNDWVPPPNVRTEYELGPKARAIYICGVSRRGYEFNLHAPCVPAPGAPQISIPMTDGQWLLLENAAVEPIPLLPEGFKGLQKAYWSCRNFQFGVAVFGYPDTQRSTLRNAEVTDAVVSAEGKGEGE